MATTWYRLVEESRIATLLDEQIDTNETLAHAASRRASPRGKARRRRRPPPAAARGAHARRSLSRGVPARGARATMLATLQGRPATRAAAAGAARPHRAAAAAALPASRPRRCSAAPTSTAAWWRVHAADRDLAAARSPIAIRALDLSASAVAGRRGLRGPLHRPHRQHRRRPDVQPAPRRRAATRPDRGGRGRASASACTYYEDTVLVALARGRGRPRAGGRGSASTSRASSVSTTLGRAGRRDAAHALRSGRLGVPGRAGGHAVRAVARLEPRERRSVSSSTHRIDAVPRARRAVARGRVRLPAPSPRAGDPREINEPSLSPRREPAAQGPARRASTSSCRWPSSSAATWGAASSWRRRPAAPKQAAGPVGPDGRGR